MIKSIKTLAALLIIGAAFTGCKDVERTTPLPLPSTTLITTPPEAYQVWFSEGSSKMNYPITLQKVTDNFYMIISEDLVPLAECYITLAQITKDPLTNRPYQELVLERGGDINQGRLYLDNYWLDFTFSNHEMEARPSRQEDTINSAYLSSLYEFPNSYTVYWLDGRDTVTRVMRVEYDFWRNIYTTYSSDSRFDNMEFSNLTPENSTLASFEVLSANNGGEKTGTFNTQDSSFSFYYGGSLIQSKSYGTFIPFELDIEFSLTYNGGTGLMTVLKDVNGGNRYVTEAWEDPRFDGLMFVDPKTSSSGILEFTVYGGGGPKSGTFDPSHGTLRFYYGTELVTGVPWK
tara:strand:+ start:93 stop:1130 length:1038 start_codon:yes stop_codon:yes gene_type:complete